MLDMESSHKEELGKFEYVKLLKILYSKWLLMVGVQKEIQWRIKREFKNFETREAKTSWDEGYLGISFKNGESEKKNNFAFKCSKSNALVKMLNVKQLQDKFDELCKLSGKVTTAESELDTMMQELESYEASEDNIAGKGYLIIA